MGGDDRADNDVEPGGLPHEREQAGGHWVKRPGFSSYLC